MLGFKEKRQIQKSIKIEYANLETAPSFGAKRTIQKSIKELYAKLNEEASEPKEVNIRAQSNQLTFDLDKVKKLDFTTYADFDEADRMITEALNRASALASRTAQTSDKHAEVLRYVESKAREFVDHEVYKALKSNDIEAMNDISDKLSNHIGVREYRWFDDATKPLDMRIIDLETEPKEDTEENLTETLETIKDVLENPNATHDDYKELEDAINTVAESEAELEDNMLYQEVITLLEELIADGTVADSINGGDLFDTVTMDSAKKEREFKTYKAWKRAVKQLDPKAKFTGDEDIDGAFKKGVFDAEWDGAEGHIIMMDSVPSKEGGDA